MTRPDPPRSATEFLGDRLQIVNRYADLLAGAAVERGLLGPREVPRLWERHLLNCAVLGELIPNKSTVIDVGSGAGLPGVVLAAARPDLTVTLVDSMLRRARFLQLCIDQLGLERVEVRRARAEELAGSVSADVVVSRAVARLPRLLEWTLPLTKAGGSVLALKGESVHAEIADLGVRGDFPWRVAGRVVDNLQVLGVGYGIIDPAATVVRAELGE